MNKTRSQMPNLDSPIFCRNASPAIRTFRKIREILYAPKYEARLDEGDFRGRFIGVTGRSVTRAAWKGVPLLRWAFEAGDTGWQAAHRCRCRRWRRQRSTNDATGDDERPMPTPWREKPW